MRFRHFCAAFAAFAVLGLTGPVNAQDYPSRFITLICPVPAGSGSDVVARIVAKELSEKLGQSVVVENRPGGNAVIGAAAVAQADPDGYTLLITAGGQAILPSTEENLPFDVVKDFEPISLLTSGPILLAANANFPPNSVPELIEYAKARPNTVRFGNTGPATIPVLAVDLLKMSSGIELVPVSYRGGAPAMVDVAAGTIEFYFSSFTAAVPFIESGKVKVLGITSETVPDFVKAMPLFANVKPVAEQGFPGYDVALTYGIFAPAKTPQDVVKRLETAIGETMKDPEIQSALSAIGIESKYMNAADYTKYFRSEIDLWAKVVKSRGESAK